MTTPGPELRGCARTPSMQRTPSMRSSRSNLTSAEAQEVADAARLTSAVERRRMEEARRVERLEEKNASPNGASKSQRAYAAVLDTQLAERASCVLRLRETEAEVHAKVHAHNVRRAR